MKNTRLAFLLAITTFMATPALAASMTMLQFGSFETREEAEKRLGELNSKHAAQIKNLPTSIREIKLPPDNLTVYRTQAGPLENRAAAQAVCSQLASAGEECYIVQTAMLPATTPSAAIADTVPATPASAALAAIAPAPSFLPVPTPAGDTNLTSKLTTLQNVPARDPSNREALSNVQSELLAQPSAPVGDAAAPMSPDMQSALDKAAAEQAATVANVNKVTAEEGAARKPGSRSFWSRVNPFSESAPVPAPSAPEAQVVAPIAAPVAVVEAMPAPTLDPVTAPVAVPVAPAAASLPMTAWPAAPAAPQMEAMRLPPPPAPLKAMPSELPVAAAMPEPIATGNVALPALNGNGSVNVEEAKRVPLTQASAPAMVPAMQAPVLAPVMSPIQPPVSLLPSSTNGQKTQWAQIGPFADNASALAFWANYRQTHPDFPVVRVRVTTPYLQYTQGVSQSWLRVGPVLRAGFIANLCTSLPEGSPLRCGHVTDLGISASPNASSGMLPGSRYKR